VFRLLAYNVIPVVHGAVVVNAVLRVMMWRLVEFERHSSVSSRDSALCWKLFVGEFMNTGILSLIVFEQSDWEIDIFYKAHPFSNGEFVGLPPRYGGQSYVL
jgi:hypothetical protein